MKKSLKTCIKIQVSAQKCICTLNDLEVVVVVVVVMVVVVELVEVAVPGMH